MKYLEQVVDTLLNTDAHVATKYVSEKQVVRATRRIYRYQKNRPSRSALELVVTVTRPNYREREFVRDCKKAGVPFPVKKVQLRFPPKQKAK